ncbi:MAG: UDP-N-acetylmuramate:L-alanyl-gamma-D-glutamyl-meso-diaminopimelate ligase [Candidatus Hydrogenedentota bacterium]
MILSSDHKPSVHFSGVGGTGMVAGARLALESGWEVRGSDMPLYPPTSEMVKALGIPIYEGYAASNLDWNPDVVVIGNALSRGNDEVEAVLERGMHYISFPEWLKDALLRDRRSVVITGTHGKTTTTSITAHVLQECGLNPGYLIGGQPLNFTHSAAIGEVGAPFVVEGDEYDTAFFDKRAKFFHYIPEIAAITSLEYDHADIYESVEAIELAFQRMLRQIPRSGHLILCADDERVMNLRDHAFSQVHTYGVSDAAEWKIADIKNADGVQQCTVHHDGALWGSFTSSLYGEHNMKNCLVAIITASLFDATPEAIQAALASFSGIRRRLEHFHTWNDIFFLDDFAHHPTAIEETIRAVKGRWPGKRVTVCFDPRSNTMATNIFQFELEASLSEADEVWVGPIFRPEKYTPETILDRDGMVERLCEHGVAAHAGTPEEIVAHFKATSDEQKIILCCSNGSFGGIYQLIRDELT